ncbi:MAG: sugar phosphate isomerase/epimerase family protein, partial [Candidatus Nanopelagicales bacterium]
MASNPLGIHALVWVGGWSPEEAEVAISSSARVGYDLIEIPALDPSRIDVASTREMLERHGLQASVTVGLSADTDINSDDVACIDRGRDLLMRALEVSSGIGSTYLGGVIFGAMMKYSAPTTERARANSIAVIKELAQEAQGSGTTIGLE